jgi:hypothetical protein
MYIATCDPEESKQSRCNKKMNAVETWRGIDYGCSINHIIFIKNTYGICKYYGHYVGREGMDAANIRLKHGKYK